MGVFEKKVTLIIIIVLLCIFIWIGLYFHESSNHELGIKILGDTTCYPLRHSLEDFLVRPNETEGFHTRLPNLSVLEWPTTEYARLPTTKAPLPGLFEPVMSRGQNLLAHKLLDIFMEQMNANEMSDRFLIYGATLLGSFRHHNFIPWDDDVDVLVDLKVRPRVREMLENLKPNYELKKGNSRDKFYTKIYPYLDSTEDVQLSRQTSSYPWGWPFLDISYYETNETHMYDIAGAYGRYYAWPNSIVFPLSYRPLGPKWYPSPRDPLGFLQASYTPSSQCSMFGYSHALEGEGPSGSIECRELGFRYPFVEHGPCDVHDSQLYLDDDDSEIVWSKESLIIRTNITDRAVIHSFCIPVPKHNIRAQTYGFDYRSDNT